MRALFLNFAVIIINFNVALPLPQALLQSLQGTPGFDERAFIKVHDRGDMLTSVRYNPAKTGRYKDALPADKVLWNPYGYYLPERPSFTQDPLFHGGLYYVQEAGSQFLWEVLSQTADRNSRARVLDLCAAPGGKTTLLSSFFANGLVVANEVIKSRVSVLTENVTKWGTGNIVVTNNDPQHFASLKNYFDVIVVDAPCSGSGLFRRDNDAIAEWSEDQVQLCSRRQQRILADVYPALKQDGLLIYSTCSYSPAEDEEILDWLADNFCLENIPVRLQAEWNITKVVSLKNKTEGCKFYPDKTRSEGFFIAAFRKTDGESCADVSRSNKLSLPDKQEAVEALKWIEAESLHQLIKHKETLLAVPGGYETDIAFLQQRLYLKKAGIAIGEIKNKGLVPAHDLAVSVIFAADIPYVQLDKAQSLQYLRRKEFALEHPVKGWALARYEELNLGWMKVLPNRVNNYYPNEWRILKD